MQTTPTEKSQMPNEKLWGGRFASTTANTAETYLASVHFDCELAFEDILGSMAHAAMLGACGIITLEESQILQQGLRTIAAQIAAGKIQYTIADEDIHMNIERLLGEHIGPTAGKLHTARSRNDQVALDMHLYLRRHLVAIVDKLNQLLIALHSQAQQNQTVILPGYTHLQRAQPISLPLHFLAYSNMLQRDITRLQNSWHAINQSPLGACALAGSPFPTDPWQVASSLGFDGIYTNSLDAVSDRDFVVEFLANCALIMLHISRLSEELILWSSQEFNFIRLDDAYCTGSSIMPQKKNPDIPELARGKTGRVYGALFSVLTTLKGLPLAYNKDLQEDKEPVFDTIKTLSNTLNVFTPLITTLTINNDCMYDAVGSGYLNATDLADYLAKKDIPFRQAHHIAGKMVAYCANKKCRLDDLSLEEMRAFSELINEDIYAALDIQQSVALRDQLAHKKQQAVSQQLQISEERIATNQRWLAAKNTLLSEVYNYFSLEMQIN